VQLAGEAPVLGRAIDGVDEEAAGRRVDEAGEQERLARRARAGRDLGAIGVGLAVGVADLDQRPVLALDVDVFPSTKTPVTPPPSSMPLPSTGRSPSSMPSFMIATDLSLSLSSTATVPSLPTATSCGACCVTGIASSARPSLE